MTIGVGDRVKRAKPRELGTSGAGTVVEVTGRSSSDGNLWVTVEWDEVRDLMTLVGCNAKRTTVRGSSLVVVEAAPKAATMTGMQEQIHALALRCAEEESREVWEVKREMGRLLATKEVGGLLVFAHGEGQVLVAGLSDGEPRAEVVPVLEVGT